MFASHTFNRTAKKSNNRIFDKGDSTYISHRGTSTTNRRSLPRKPIFDQGDFHLPLNLPRHHAVLYSMRPALQPKKLFEDQLMTFDFCGCENQVTPCEIFQRHLLKNVSLPEMKEEHNRISAESEINKKKQSRNKNLFQTLPRNYPELFTSHLNNNLNLIDGDMSWPEFSCLAWVQYHAKIEYVTYFLYLDLKKSFKNKIKFIDNLHDELLRPKSNFFRWKKNFLSQGFMETFDAFVSSYYQSVGASFIPLTHYAQFVKMIKKRGNGFLLGFLVNFIIKRHSQLEKAFRYLELLDIQGYRDFISQLNWDSYFQQYDE